MNVNKFLEKAKKNIRGIQAHILALIANKKYIVVKAPVKMAKGKVCHFNWGDDMNYYFVELLSQKKPFLITDSQFLNKFPIQSFLVIGSTVSFYPLDGVTIWGAGIINQNDIKNIKGKPDKICAVRGPLTRQALIKLGYECPQVYGDPILLLPRFYKPEHKAKKYKIGIIPHYIDKETDIIKSIKLGSQNINVIDVQRYVKWNDFVDEICSCEAILSSSLHGLICAEAYGVPHVWIALSDYPEGWEFKFNDFYSSIGKESVNPIRLRQEKDLYGEDIKEALSAWKKGNIDLDLLLSVCPFYCK